MRHPPACQSGESAGPHALHAIPLSRPEYFITYLLHSGLTLTLKFDRKNLVSLVWFLYDLLAIRWRLNYRFLLLTSLVHRLRSPKVFQYTDLSAWSQRLSNLRHPISVSWQPQLVDWVIIPVAEVAEINEARVLCVCVSAVTQTHRHKIRLISGLQRRKRTICKIQTYQYVRRAITDRRQHAYVVQ